MNNERSLASVLKQAFKKTSIKKLGQKLKSAISQCFISAFAIIISVL